MKPVRVLIIDDNTDFALRLQQCFATSDLFEVLPCVGGSQDALQAFAGLQPDIAILDMIMPQMDGMDILRNLHAAKTTPDTMIFATTPFYLNPAIIQQAMDLGVVYFFYKPIDPSQVFTRVKETVQARSRIFSAPAGAKTPAHDLRCETITVNYLRALGVPAHLKGYAYIKSALQYCVSHGGKVPNISTELFPILGEPNGASWKTVDRDVRTAIEYAWNHGNMDAQHQLFGYTVDRGSGAPTCKEFIAMLCERVVMRMKQKPE
ncbi:MAG: sporulation initiation factor Spo0A C-terminal domain-containing protein [Clostridia bacterium]|nr:sporulation initiation factor Spo0A C-terminal domain-containing protein [Clostridia bacterium]